MDNHLEFIDPTVGGGNAKIALAPRPMDLAGKVVGMLDNTKEQGDVILQTIGDALRERHGVARVIIKRKEHYSKPATDAPDRRDRQGGPGRDRGRRRVRVLHVVQCARHHRIRETRHSGHGHHHGRPSGTRACSSSREGHGRPSVHRAAAPHQQPEAGRDEGGDAALRRPGRAPARGVSRSIHGGVIPPTRQVNPGRDRAFRELSTMGAVPGTPVGCWRSRSGSACGNYPRWGRRYAG